MSKFCVNCGEELTDECRFCSNCGYKQPDPIPKSKPQFQNENHAPVSSVQISPLVNNTVSSNNLPLSSNRQPFAPQNQSNSNIQQANVLQGNNVSSDKPVPDSRLSKTGSLDSVHSRTVEQLKNPPQMRSGSPKIAEKRTMQNGKVPLSKGDTGPVSSQKNEIKSLTNIPTGRSKRPVSSSNAPSRKSNKDILYNDKIENIYDVKQAIKKYDDPTYDGYYENVIPQDYDDVGKGPQTSTITKKPIIVAAVLIGVIILTVVLTVLFLINL